MPKHSAPWVRFAKRLTAVAALLILAGICVGLVWGIKEYNQAESMIEGLEDRLTVTASTPSKIVSSDGKVLYEVVAEYRKPIRSLDDVPEQVRDAFLAAEDHRFYEHSGVDPVGVGRAVLSAVQDRRATQGGSTITMQLAKRLFSGSERTLDRKLQDVAMAQAIERRMTKDQIFLLYLNQVYFGQGAYGLAAASDVYFRKDYRDLSLSEAATLARCVRRPSSENPVRNMRRALINRNVVLANMLDLGWIDKPQYDKALEESLRVNPNPPRFGSERRAAPYFVDHVLAKVRRDLPDIDIDTGGYRIETTLNYEVQKVAEEAVRRIVRQNASRNVTTAAFVIMDARGRILAEVGGVDFRRNQFNIVTQGRRQPGSAFKPIVYAVGLYKGVVSLDGSVSNEKIRMKDESQPGGYWTPRNMGRDSWGSAVSLRTAMAYSINRPAIHTILEIGPSTVVQFAQDSFGFQSKLGAYPTLALGASEVTPLEMAQAYSVFMLKGDRATPYPITRVIGPEGEIVKEYFPDIRRNVFDVRACTEVDELLRDVVEYGTGKLARSVPEARGKTGTTNDGRDAWFAGYAEGLVGVGWIGNEQLRPGRPARYLPTREAYGGTVTVQIWTAVMNAAREVLARTAPAEAPEERTEPAPKEIVPPALAKLKQPEATPDDENAFPDETPPLEPKPENTDPQATPPGPPVPREEPPPSADESVEVEICVESGQLSTPYCSETVTRKFRKGSEPKGRCRLHSPPP